MNRRQRRRIVNRNNRKYGRSSFEDFPPEVLFNIFKYVKRPDFHYLAMTCSNTFLAARDFRPSTVPTEEYREAYYTSKSRIQEYLQSTTGRITDFGDPEYRILIGVYRKALDVRPVGRTYDARSCNFEGLRYLYTEIESIIYTGNGRGCPPPFEPLFEHAAKFDNLEMFRWICRIQHDDNNQKYGYYPKVKANGHYSPGEYYSTSVKQYILRYDSIRILNYLIENFKFSLGSESWYIQTCIENDSVRIFSLIWDKALDSAEDQIIHDSPRPENPREQARQVYLRRIIARGSFRIYKAVVPESGDENYVPEMRDVILSGNVIMLKYFLERGFKLEITPDIRRELAERPRCKMIEYLHRYHGLAFLVEDWNLFRFSLGLNYKREKIIRIILKYTPECPGGIITNQFLRQIEGIDIPEMNSLTYRPIRFTLVKIALEQRQANM